MIANTAEQPMADVDVIIPLYNGTAFIEQAIRSVLTQTILPRSITIVDDGSTDASAEHVRSIIQNSSSPTYLVLVQQENAGPNAARNTGLRKGSAAYVAFLDADDMWLPRKLEVQLACFNNSPFPDLMLVCCGAQKIDDTGRTVLLPATMNTTQLHGHVFDQLLIKNRIAGGASAVLIKRSCFELVGGFDEKLRTSEDYDMWLRISQIGAVDTVSEELVALRDHAKNNSKDAMHMLKGMLHFNAKWFDHAWQRPDVLNEWGHLVALFVSRTKDPRSARALVRATLTRPQQRALFRKTFGSLRLYAFLKQCRAILDSFRS